MNRRDWLKGGAALAAVAGMTQTTNAQAATAAKTRSYLLLRRYRMQSGPTLKAANTYFSDALIPALGRLGLGPVGVFTLTYGDATPQMFLLTAGNDLEMLAQLDLRLGKDTAFVQQASAFWGAAAANPPFVSSNSQLSIGMEGFPALVVPKKEPRILQLRTYVSPTYAAHERKVEMFHQGEFRIFEEAGARGVFYADDLIAPNQPSLTYMLAHKDLASMDANWKAFQSHPDWKKLSALPRYSSEAIVSHVDNLVLTPTAYSQI